MEEYGLMLLHETLMVTALNLSNAASSLWARSPVLLEQPLPFCRSVLWGSTGSGETGSGWGYGWGIGRTMA